MRCGYHIGYRPGDVQGAGDVIQIGRQGISQTQIGSQPVAAVRDHQRVGKGFAGAGGVRRNHFGHCQSRKANRRIGVRVGGVFRVFRECQVDVVCVYHRLIGNLRYGVWKRGVNCNLECDCYCLLRVNCGPGNGKNLGIGSGRCCPTAAVVVGQPTGNRRRGDMQAAGDKRTVGVRQSIC